MEQVPVGLLLVLPGEADPFSGTLLLPFLTQVSLLPAIRIRPAGPLAYRGRTVDNEARERFQLSSLAKIEKLVLVCGEHGL